MRKLYTFALFFVSQLILATAFADNASANCLPSSSTQCSAATTQSACIATYQSGTSGSLCYWGNTTVGSGDQNAFVDTLCNALRIVTGNGGKAFAAFAIISVGIGFFTGKVSWGLMIGVTAGIAAMFGAPTIVAAIAGGNAFDCTAN